MVKIIFLGSRPLSIKALELLGENVRLKSKNRVEITVLTSSDDHPPKDVKRWWQTGTLGRLATEKGFRVLKSPSQLENESFDLGISVFSTDIIPQHIIKKIPGGVTNIHFGYLPTAGYPRDMEAPRDKGKPFSKGVYRGSNVLSHAILAGEKWQAITFHFMGDHIDLGPVIEQSWTPIINTTTAWDLQQKSELKAMKLFKKYFPSIIDNPKSIKTIPAGRGKYPYFSRPRLEKFRILDSNMPQSRLDLVARALSFPQTEPPYFLEKDSHGRFRKRYVIYKKGKGTIIMKPRKTKFIQKLSDIA